MGLRWNQIILITTLFLLSTQLMFSQVSGWKKQHSNNFLKYVPENLTGNKTFYVLIYEPVSIDNNNLKNWLLENAKKQQTKLGRPLDLWKVNPVKDGIWATSNRYKNNGESFSVLYFCDKLNSKQVFLSQIVTSSDVNIIKQYTPKIPEIKKDALKTFSKSTKTITKTKKEAKYKTQNLKQPRDLLAIWSVNIWGYKPSSGMWGVNEKIVAALKNGRITDNLPAIFSGTTGKKLKKGQWGDWRKKGNKIEIRWDGDKKFKKTEYSVHTKPGASNQVLEGCYARFVSYSDSHMGGDFNFAAVKTWCFNSNGRFVLSTSSNTTFPIAIAKSKAKTRGTYQIDGYVMKLTFDNGKIIHTGFAFLNDNNTITINGNRLRKQ